VDEETADQHWHVTRGIPVAFILTMLVMFVTQTATAAWFASAMAYRVEAVERAQAQAAPQGERLTRVEEKLVAVNTGIADIKALLQKPSR
jgi:cell division protein FtsB